MRGILSLIIFYLPTSFGYCQTVGFYNFQTDEWNVGACSHHITPLFGMPNCNTNDFQLVFEENFDGNALDVSKWNFDNTVTRDFAFEQEKQWYQSDNIEVSNGSLKIIADKFDVPYEGTFVTSWTTDPITNQIVPATTQTAFFDYSSAEISTKDAFYWGKYEIRFRLPAGKGFWPAFWTFGGPGWNEIDFFEMHGDDMDRFTCNVHHDYDFDGHSENCSYSQDDLVDFSEWHILECVFDYDGVTWYLDGFEGPSYYRFYSTGVVDEIKCGDNIGYGNYIEMDSYPTEPMKIILNLAMSYPENAPDITTPFPSIYEIDYVKYYAQVGDCDGCIENMTYENINNLPSSTRVTDYIIAGTNTVVQSGQDVSFKAGNFIELTELVTEPGGVFNAYIETCDFISLVDIPITYLGHNALEDYQVVHCVNPIYEIEAVGMSNYSCNIYNEAGLLVYSSSGFPTSNILVSWDATNVAVGWYRVELNMSNCLDIDNREYWLLVFDACGKMNLSNEKASLSESINFLEPKLLLFPNPTNKILNIDYTINNEQILEIQISDIEGKEILNIENIDGKIGRNIFTFDISSFAEGIYILKIKSQNDISNKVFIVSK